MICQTLTTILIAVALCVSAAAQRGQPLVMDSFKDSVYLLHMGNIVIRARCVSTEVVSSDHRLDVKPHKCTNGRGVLELPGDSVEAFRWKSAPPGKEGTEYTESSYEVFPNGEIDVTMSRSRCGATVDNSCSWAPWYLIRFYHFKVLEMHQTK